MAYEGAAAARSDAAKQGGGDTGFSTRLRPARLSAGFATARQFAQALGLAENRYTRYERGETEPALGTIARICRILTVTPDDLLGFSHARATRLQSSGFAEQPVPPPRSPDDDDARLIAGRQRLLCWHLARACTPDFGPHHAGPHDTDMAVEPRTDILRLRKTCELFRRIERDPLGFIAATVESTAVDELPAERQLSLARAVEELCAILGPPSARDQAQ